MAYDQHLAERIRQTMNEKHVKVEEKQMMGGLCFMVNDKMCVGVVKKSLMARVGADSKEMALTRKGCREMDFTGRPLSGFVLVDPVGIDADEDLEFWINACLAFNPLAKSSKKRKA